MSEVMHATVGQIDKVNTHLGVVDSNLCWHDSRISLLEGLSRELSYTIDCYITPCLCGLYDDIYNPDDGLEHKLANVVKIYGQIDCDIGGIRNCLTCIQDDIDKVKNDASADLENAINDLSTRIDNIPTEYPYLPLDVTCDTNVTVGWCNTLLFKDSKNNTLIQLTPDDLVANNGITIGYKHYNNGVKLLGHSVIVDSNAFEVDASSNFRQGLSASNKVYAECGLYVGCNNGDGYAISTYGTVRVGEGSIIAECGSVSASDEVNGRWFNAYCCISVGYDYPSHIEGCSGLLTISSCSASIFTNNGTSLYVGSCDDMEIAETKVSLTNSGVYFNTPSVEFSDQTDVTFCGDIKANIITASSIEFYDYSCGCNHVGGISSCSTGTLSLSADNLDISSSYSLYIASCGNAISISQGQIALCGEVYIPNSLTFEQNAYIDICCGSNLFIDNGAGMKFLEGRDNCGYPTGEILTLDYATVKELLALQDHLDSLASILSSKADKSALEELKTLVGQANETLEEVV